MKKFRALGASLVATGLLASAPLAADTEPPARPDHDLSVMYSVSPLKKSGHPGLVALHVSNVGTKNYYAPSLVVQFIVKVHTVSGPTDVNRVITPKGYNGATVTDLGLDLHTHLPSDPRQRTSLGREPGRRQLQLRRWPDPAPRGSHRPGDHHLAGWSSSR